MTPRLDYDSHVTGLDRNELGALRVAAGRGHSAEHALISLLALNRLRVSEATGASIEALGVERGHGTLTITRKGGSQAPGPAGARGKAGHSSIAAIRPPTQPQVQVERPQRSEDERPGGAARRRPYSAAR